jgi:hypothetical protein
MEIGICLRYNRYKKLALDNGMSSLKVLSAFALLLLWYTSLGGTLLMLLLIFGRQNTEMSMAG